MNRSFITALTFFISCQVTEISDPMEENGLSRIVFCTNEEEYGCVVECADGYHDIEMSGEIVYRLEPELITICKMSLVSQGATILRVINAGRRDELFSYRTNKFLKIIEEIVEAFAYSRGDNKITADLYIYPVVINNIITPLHLN